MSDTTAACLGVFILAALTFIGYMAIDQHWDQEAKKDACRDKGGIVAPVGLNEWACVTQDGRLILK